MMTESEARTKWCPLARTPWALGREGEAAAVNRWVTTNAAGADNCFAVCLGSACMAWRWHRMPPRKHCRCLNSRAKTEEHAGQKPAEAAGWEFVPYNADGEDGLAHWLEPEAQCRDRWRGYCGAFGDPPDLVRRVETIPPER